MDGQKKIIAIGKNVPAARMPQTSLGAPAKRNAM
jgi:hypothetical protein